MVFPSKIFSVMFWFNCVFIKVWYGSTDMMKKFCEIMLHTNESQNEFGNQMSCGQIINFYFVVFQNSSDVSKKIWDTTTLFFFHYITIWQDYGYVSSNYSWEAQLEIFKTAQQSASSLINISTLELCGIWHEAKKLITPKSGQARFLKKV